RDVLRSENRKEDWDPLLNRFDGQLERLARTVGEGKLERLAMELDLLASQRHADDRYVLARPLQLLAEPDAVEAFGHLRAGAAKAEQHAAARQVVDRGRGHRGHGGAPRRDLEDAGAELDSGGPRGQPGQHGPRVRTISLGRPDGVVA